MSDKTFFAVLLTIVGALVTADCVRSIRMTSALHESIRKAYEKCDAEGIPRVRCRI